MTTRIILCALGLVAAQTALAQEIHDPLAGSDLYVSERFIKATSQWMDESQAQTLKSIAHQSAVAAACDGFDVDPERFVAEGDGLYTEEQTAALTEEEKDTRDSQTTFAFGMVYGAQLAIAAQDVGGFCANGEDERANPNAEHIIWAME